MSAAELPEPEAIPQPHSPFENVQYEALVVPAIFVEKFHAVSALAEARFNDIDVDEITPNLVAAVTIDDRSFPHETLATRVHKLAIINQFVKEHPGEPFVNADRPSVTAGIIDENEGLVVIPWYTTISYGTGLAIPARQGIDLDFFGSDYDRFTAEKELPPHKHMRFITPDMVVLNSGSFEVIDAFDTAMHGGVLAVGEDAVAAFFEGLDRTKVTREVSRALDRKY
jgi:hypothetical protein